MTTSICLSGVLDLQRNIGQQAKEKKKTKKKLQKTTDLLKTFTFLNISAHTALYIFFFNFEHFNHTWKTRVIFITPRIFSAVGRFFGFFVKHTFTKLWKAGDLLDKISLFKTVIIHII